MPQIYFNLIKVNFGFIDSPAALSYILRIIFYPLKLSFMLTDNNTKKYFVYAIYSIITNTLLMNPF